MSHVPRTREKVSYVFPGSLSHYSMCLYGLPDYTFHYVWPSAQLTENLHRCHDMTHPGPPYRCGSGFSTWHYTSGPYDCGSFDVRTSANWDTTYHYWGTFRPSVAQDSAAPSYWLSTWGDGSSYGATGYNRYKPGKPGAGLAQFIGELRDMPRMFQFKVKRFKDLGSQYLNYQFGWRPFVNDLLKFLKTTQNLSKRLEFFRRNNGKVLKRGGTVHSGSTSSSEIRPGTFLHPTFPSYFYPDPSSHSYTVRTTLTSHVWFAGAFRFWIPDIGSPDWINRVTRQMYGANLSPSVVWELIPWSWLVDWFSNVGDVMSNLSSSEAAENLVALYAYLMTHTVYEVNYTQNIYRVYTDVSKRQEASYAGVSHTQKWERKQRIAASPYGFGLTWDGFSPRQLAILAALGLSRSH